MARKKKETMNLAQDMDMTPMIDIVFLLIIFFMVVTEISRLQVEEIQLPVANQAEEKEPPTTDRKMVVNIVEDGTIKIGGAIYAGTLLESFLSREAIQAGVEDVNANNPELRPSRLVVTVRADKNCEWQYVQNFFEAAQKAGIYKVSMAATKEPDAKDE